MQAGAGGAGPNANGTNGQAAGAIYLNQTNLVADGTTATIVVSEITGDGNVVKNGTGVLYLQGTHTYSGDTQVHAGTFALNGSVAENVAVDAGAVFAGNATVNGDVNLNGTISPGNSIGTVNIGGNLNMASTSTLDIEIDPAGNHDTINVTGQANLNGLVNVQALPGSYTTGTTYTFLNAAGGVNGTFSGIVDDLPFFDAQLIYAPLFVQLELIANSNDYTSIASNFNQWQVANYLDNLGAPGGDLGNVLNQLNLLNTAQAQAGLQSMDAEIYGSFAQLNVQNLTYQYLLIRRRAGAGLGSGLQSGGLAASAGDTQIVFVSSDGGASRPLFRSAVERGECWSAWATGYGIGGTVATDGNAGGGNYGLGGTIFALERFLDNQHALGFFGSYTNMNLRIDGPVQSAVGNVGQFGSYLVGDDGFNYWLAAG
ncbi:MAG: autotransporter-associated beta strand repeat-containing protein, partial [Planctomycetaceae bacterium]|nr:autotransporter-associated beta strand repeat-containing protein [Planctomycetaceae bacterium]